jgi:hypothetical protein
VDLNELINRVKSLVGGGAGPQGTQQSGGPPSSKDAGTASRAPGNTGYASPPPGADQPDTSTGGPGTAQEDVGAGGSGAPQPGAGQGESGPTP